MAQQLWRLNDGAKRALLAWKREKRYVAELKQNLVDLSEIAWDAQNEELKVWCRQQVASIRHELDEIEAGRLTTPEDWKG